MAEILERTAETRETGETEEAQLLGRCRTGDEAAWNSLVKRYEPLLFRFARSLCRNSEDAGDAVGITLIKLHRHIHSLDTAMGLRSWLFRVLRNACCDIAYRSQEKRNLSLDEPRSGNREEAREYPDPALSPMEKLIAREQAALLEREIAHLPSYQRNTLRMYHLDGYSYEEIAEATGSAAGTVKSRLNRARAMLRCRLEGRL